MLCLLYFDKKFPFVTLLFIFLFGVGYAFSSSEAKESHNNAIIKTLLRCFEIYF